MKLAREEIKIKVTGRSFYRKNNLKFKGRNRNRRKKNLRPGTGTWAKWHGSATLTGMQLTLRQDASI
jgi:hypothetical protein